MIPLSRLNKICLTRLVSRTVPAQVACRLLGNDRGPCVIDKICAPCDKHGAWFLYGVLLTGLLVAFLGLFWVLRLTRLSRVLGLILRIFSPPLRWSLDTALWFKDGFDSLSG
jgi:hypothetical protein